jgi:WD40 repeat protein
VRVWRTSGTEQPTQLLRQSTGALTALAFSPDGRWLAAGNADGAVYLWRVAALAEPPLLYQGHLGSVHAI